MSNLETNVCNSEKKNSLDFADYFHFPSHASLSLALAWDRFKNSFHYSIVAVRLRGRAMARE